MYSTVVAVIILVARLLQGVFYTSGSMGRSSHPRCNVPRMQVPFLNGMSPSQTSLHISSLLCEQIGSLIQSLPLYFQTGRSPWRCREVGPLARNKRRQNPSRNDVNPPHDLADLPSNAHQKQDLSNPRRHRRGHANNCLPSVPCKGNNPVAVSIAQDSLPGR